MTGQLLIDSKKLSVVQLTQGDRWVRLALWLSDEFAGGELVHVGNGAPVSIEATDSPAASYARANWFSGVASGALFAFRALRLPRQQVVIAEFSGRLGGSDMEAVASAAAMAIAALADKQAPFMSAEQWSGQAQVTERSPMEALQQNSRVERMH